jgi:hypothetical protein
VGPNAAKGKPPNLTSSLFRADDAPMELVQPSVSSGMLKPLISEGFTASRLRLLLAFALQHKSRIEIT